jgi:hypothetical protein
MDSGEPQKGQRPTRLAMIALGLSASAKGIRSHNSARAHAPVRLPRRLRRTVNRSKPESFPGAEGRRWPRSGASKPGSRALPGQNWAATVRFHRRRRARSSMVAFDAARGRNGCGRSTVAPRPRGGAFSSLSSFGFRQRSAPPRSPSSDAARRRRGTWVRAKPPRRRRLRGRPTPSRSATDRGGSR